MSTWTLIQIVFDIFVATALFTIVMRMNRAPKDDPRLSRGLQLLQSKISVLEDLSDRTEVQVNQLTAILEQKAREVQAKVQLAEQHVHEIKVSMERSLEVAQIFQDKIPHKEIIERQNTIKYVQAARLAHKGASVEEIAKQVDLPKGEIEFIASVNRERLMFDENDLPEWARGEATSPPVAAPAAPSASFTQATTAFTPAMPQFGFEEPKETAEENAARLRAEMELAERQRLVENLSRLQFEMQTLDMELSREQGARDLSGAFEVPRVETASLKKLGEEFRKAVEEGQKNDSREQLFPLEQISSTISQVISSAESFANGATAASPAPTTGEATLSSSFAGRATAATLKQALSQASAALNQGANAAVANAQQALESALAAQASAQPQASSPNGPLLPASLTNRGAPAASVEPRDPVLARALAQQKVQAALRASAPAAKAPQASPELEQARAMARAESQPQPVTHIVRERTLSGAQPSNDKTVIKKVLFPRLDEPEV